MGVLRDTAFITGERKLNGSVVSQAMPALSSDKDR